MTTQRCGIGIDIGTSCCRVAMWGEGGLNILSDDFGTRTNSSCITFVDDQPQPIVGDIAQHLAHLNAQCSIRGIKRLLGRKYDDPFVKRAMQKMDGTFKVVSDEKKKQA